MTEEVNVDLNEDVFSFLTGNTKRILMMDNEWYDVKAINSASISHISFNVEHLTLDQGKSLLNLIQSEKVAEYESIRHKELMKLDPDDGTGSTADPSII